MGISRSTVYYKRKTPIQYHLEEEILKIFMAHNGNYGAPRIKVVMAQQSHRVSKRRIGKVLKNHGLESKHGRRKLAKNIYTATQERYIADNLIKGVVPTASNQICQMDASQFKCRDGKVVVSGIIDVYDKTVVIDYGASENKTLILDTIRRRLAQGIPGTLHSDRGAGNASLKVKELLARNHILRSMSAPHSPNENQYIETFWKTAKTEIGNTSRLTCCELKMVLDYYVHYYNNERIHSAIAYLTPYHMRSLSLPPSP